MRDILLIRQLRLVWRVYKDGREWGTAGLSEPGAGGGALSFEIGFYADIS